MAYRDLTHLAPSPPASTAADRPAPSPVGSRPHFHVAGHAIRAQVDVCRLPGCDSPRAHGLGGFCSEACGERHYEFMRDAEAER